MQHQGCEILPIFPLATQMSPVSLVKKALLRSVGRFYRGDRDPGFLSAIAAEFGRRTRGSEFDIVFSPGSEAVSALTVPQPITFCADATFANMLDYYWDFSSLSEEYVRKGHELESNALRRAALAVYPSEWAARSAIDFYGADPAKVFVIPFGANLGSDNQRDQVERWAAERRFDSVRLLFVGKSWTRKGGDIVVATARLLLSRGIPVHVDIVSVEMPAELGLLPWITNHGYLNPNLPDQAAVLTGLFKAAHFLFIPSRAEAFGLAFAEASAFGVPSVATDTGGIPSAITPGVNGFILPLAAGAGDYADRIAAVFSNRGEYEALCRGAFGEFERRLNWRSFCTRFLELARITVADAPQPARCVP
jgi:glycosyltransferase involved in cell wall biosynthesis